MTNQIKLKLSCLLLFISMFLSTNTMAAGATPVSLYKTYSGNIDYVATGGSFRDQPNSVDSCSFVNPMSSSIVLNIPATASIVQAFLYFSGSGSNTAPIHNVSTQVGLTLNGSPISTFPGFDGANYEITETIGTTIDFFAARRDVTSIVTGPGSYTFAGLDVHTVAEGRPNNQTCLGAWELVVVYEDIGITDLRVLNLFDGFEDFQFSNFDLQPRNFVLRAGAAGKMTHITYEGDETLGASGGFEERFKLAIPAGGTLFDLTNGLNPIDNQFNGTLTGPDVFDVSNTFGLDIDTYDISAILAGQEDSFTATTNYSAAQDLVILQSEIIIVDNKNLADIEVTLNDIGSFISGTINSVQYVISVQNNGDGLSNPSSGFATGYIHVYDDLPTGISIDNLTDITAPGWNCSATNLGGNQVRCLYDLSTLPGGQLDKGGVLPDIFITVDVAAPPSPVTNIARITLCDNNPDTCTTFDNKHTDASEFDPINFFEETDDIFDVFSKSSTNNNVDSEITPIITGTPSNLSTSTKTPIDLNGATLLPGDIIEYTITLIETAGITATGVSISDVIDVDTSSFSFQSTSCSGSPVDSFSLGTFTMTGINVLANTSCDVVFQVTVGLFVSAGSAIDNSATVVNGNGSGTVAIAPTLLVAGTATGSKILYLDALNTGSRELTRNIPGLDTTASVADPGSITVNLTPSLAADLDINSGIIPVSVWIEATTTGNYDITAELRYDSGGANTLIGSDSLNNVAMLSGVGNALLYPFQINLGAAITDLDAGENISLTISNGAGSPGNAILHSLLSSTQSNIIVDAVNVINIDTITFYSDPARTISITTLEAGQDIYIEAVISDPFGAFDISDARLTLIDPTLANQLTAASMTEDIGAITAGTKTYFTAYTVPPAVSIPPGIWVAQITGDEGAEGTVSHTDVNNFSTTAPSVTVDYTVTPLTSIPGGTLTYTISIINGSGGATSLNISQAIPLGTTNLNITVLPSGNDSASTSTLLDIQSIVANPGTTVIQFTVDVLGSAQAGDLIDHTISLNNMGTSVDAAAPSVLILPFVTPAGNKLLYADSFGGVAVLDRTLPTSDSSRSISSQGGNTTLVLSPVLQSDLSLAAGVINTGIWVTRDPSFAGQRVIEATLAYAGASTGTIGTDNVTINLAEGASGAQYIPFNFNLASASILLANTSITLKVTNNTSVFGESINIHTFQDGVHATQIALNATTPLTIEAIEVLDNDIDLGGVIIGSASPGDSIWIRATVQDPFGSADISSATLTITDPLAAVTLPTTLMIEPTTQPVSGAQKYFQLNHVLSAELGDWNLAVVTQEGFEGTVSASDNLLFNINNNQANLTDSFKSVSNATTGSNANTNEGDTLHYTIELVESGNSNATSVTVTDVIPTNTTFVSGTLTIDSIAQPDPGATISLTGLTVPSLGNMTIEFDVTVDIPTSTGAIISNTADITNPTGVVTSLEVMAEDIVIAGSPASGTKFIYLENLNTTPIITRLEPQVAGASDAITLAPEGGSVNMDLTLAGAISLNPADHPGGNVIVRFRVSGAGAFFGFRQIRGTLGYHNGGAVTPIGTITQNFNTTGTTSTQILSIPLSTITNIPAGNQLRLTISNITTAFFGETPNITVSSFDGGGGSLRSHMEIVPNPVINVDSISFWSDTMGAGVEVTNPDPNGVDVDIYAKIVISDPFGDNDIQAPDTPTNPSTINIIDPDGNAVLDLSTACVAPCYAYDGEDIINDPPGNATRTFYFIIRIDSDPPATRGTWTVQMTANEGLETGVISHTLADGFTTLSQSNLSTSSKNWSHAGDVDPGETLTYTVTLMNTGGQDADNAIFSDTLATSPVSLTFSSASTTCLDEGAAALPAPSHSGGVVSLSNISVLTGGNCIITINTVVGAGSPGDLIDNIASIINPNGAGANPAAPTVILSQSQIAAIGSKQLYLDNLGGVATLGRGLPTTISEATINAGATLQVNYSLGTEKEMVLETGTIALDLRLRKTGGGFNSDMEFELFVNPNDGGGFDSVDSVATTFFLGASAQTIVLSLTNSIVRTLNVGSLFRLEIRNAGGGTTVFVSQVASTPFSQVQLPVSGALEVTDLRFFDLSGNDAGGCAPTCGTEILPAGTETGSTIWARAVISDAFGSNDVNTGCDGVTNTNCPTITITDPTSANQTPASPADELNFLTAPDLASRTYEFEVTPAGFGLEGIWQIEILGKEGTENVISDTAISTFELFGNPVLTVVKTFSGTASPGLIITYNNDVTNSGTGPATNVDLTNEITDFISLELTESSGNWTSQFSITAAFTVDVESFDTGDNSFTYDPVVFCGAAIPSNSPCYDPSIVGWRIELIEQLPVGDTLVQEYRVIIQ